MGVEKLDFPSPSGEVLTATPISYEIERQVLLGYGLLEIGRCHWPTPVEIEICSKDDRVACNLALSPRPAHGKLEQVDGTIGCQEGLERVMLLNPGRSYRLSLPPGKVRSLYCEIDRSAIEEILDRPIQFDEDNWQERFRLRMPAIELILNRMYEELREEDFASELALDAYSHALRIELARCLRPVGTDEGPVRKGGLPPWRMRLLRDRVHAEMPAPRIPELADLCGMTVRQISRAFKEETGKALGAYVMDATIERAVALLTQSDRSIVQIASDLGFASSTSFSYSFRRSTGVLPREMRRRAVASSAYSHSS